MSAEYVTKFEVMPTSVVPDDKTLCERKDITHIVTGIRYGMAAVFDFKKIVQSSESKEDIEESLKVGIRSIPSMKIEGETNVSSLLCFHKATPSWLVG